MLNKIAFVIPVYNHCNTLKEVVVRTMQVIDKINEKMYLFSNLAQVSHADIIVIDDGSTDNSLETVQELEITTLSHEINKGKGVAILTAAQHALENNYTHIITLDSDAQHFPEDIPKFLKAIEKDPFAFIVGARDFKVENIPFSSRFGRKFSAFWMFVQSGKKVSDMQSGFRAYNIEALLCLNLKETRYAFEVEALVKAAWSGFAIEEIPIQVLYQKGEERISHFDKTKDNIRMTVLNTKLTVRALVPIPFKHHAIEVESKTLSLLSPLQSLHYLLQKSSPFHLALSAMIAFFVCLLPLLGLQSIILLLCINTFNLNRLCALLIIPLTWPPVMPAVCILVGYRVINGVWLTNFSMETLYYEFWYRFVDWIIGSVLLAPVLGIVMGLFVYSLSICLKLYYKNK